VQKILKTIVRYWRWESYYILAKSESYDLKTLANGLGFEARTLSQVDSDGSNGVQLTNLHQAARMDIMDSDYDLRIIKGGIMYLAASSSVTGNEVRRPV
jgi:hypothetical protein